MTPFYADALVTLYHGDCRALIQQMALAQRTVVVTDPPYGIAYRSHRHGAISWRGKDRAWDATDGFDVAASLSERFPTACFAKWNSSHPFKARGCLVWDKCGSGSGNLRFPWKPSWELIYICGAGWSGRRDSGVFVDGSMNSNKRLRQHPTQKPIPLLEHLIFKCPGHDVFDPFAGSGSTGVAAKRLGRRCILIEQDAHYCEVAAKRLSETEAAEPKEAA